MKNLQQVKEIFYSDHTKEYPKNFSYGIIEVREDHNGIGVMELLEQADAIMYKQKKEYKKKFR